MISVMESPKGIYRRGTVVFWAVVIVIRVVRVISLRHTILRLG